MLQNVKNKEKSKRYTLGCIFCACDIGIHVFSCSFCVEFGRVLYKFCMFFDTFPEQSNTGNRKNECILSHLDTSRVGVSFWQLQDRNPCFFVLILRWFWMHFGVILHDFGLPSGGLISVYDWSSEQVKTRNFHHFFKRFWHPKNQADANVLWISWKMRTKLGRHKVDWFRAIYTPWSGF